MESTISIGAGNIDLVPRISNPLFRGGFSILHRPLERVLHLREFGRLYDDLQLRGDNVPFLQKLLDRLNVTCKVSDDDLRKLPSTGPAIIVANHPFGAVEGVILCSILRSIRPDVKVMANYLLGLIPEIRENFFLVDPYVRESSLMANIKPLRETLNWLKNGGMLGVFPAGEVAHATLKSRKIVDPKWNESIGRIIRKTETPVIPVYFSGINSALFHLLGLAHPRVRTAMLPRELLNKANREVEMHIGRPISYSKLSAFETDREMMDYLRMRTYMLANRKEKQGIHPEREAVTYHDRIGTRVISLRQDKAVAGEVASLGSESILLENHNYTVYEAVGERIPRIMQEIGRLREITFRAAGEGTGKSLDIDQFDSYYTQLFLWHKEGQEIVGAYRLGMTDEILPLHGKGGLYTRTLFNYGARFLNQIYPAIELGRSFVRPEYQRQYQPLLLLWKGIGRFVYRRRKYRHLFGPVSIDEGYNSASRQLMISFLERNNLMKDLSKLVKAKNPLKLKALRREELRTAMEFTLDFGELSDIVSEIEGGRGVPILLKHYVGLGAMLVESSIDPHFSGVLDALIVVDLAKTDHKLLEHHMGRDEAAQFLRYHALAESRTAALAS
ncbi:MAG: lysophospholipid acyltransferase family protein [Candidatus Coatesbacteria bacterium]|nr:lysophospholipid acyltransferase family protein [Candidatus Coatesbacteria bacterium]